MGTAVLLAGCTTTNPQTTSSSTATSGQTTSMSKTSTVSPALHVHVKCSEYDPTQATLKAKEEALWHGHCGTHTVTIHKQGDPNGKYLMDQQLNSTLSFVFPDPATIYHVFCKFHSDGENGNYETGMVSQISTASS